MSTLSRKLAQATIARDYAREIGDVRLARKMTARINDIISQIAWGA